MSKRAMNVWRVMVLVLAAGGAMVTAFDAEAMSFSWYGKEVKDIVVPDKVDEAETAYKVALQEALRGELDEDQRKLLLVKLARLDGRTATYEAMAALSEEPFDAMLAISELQPDSSKVRELLSSKDAKVQQMGIVLTMMTEVKGDSLAELHRKGEILPANRQLLWVALAALRNYDHLDEIVAAAAIEEPEEEPAAEQVEDRAGDQKEARKDYKVAREALGIYLGSLDPGNATPAEFAAELRKLADRVDKAATSQPATAPAAKEKAKK